MGSGAFDFRRLYEQEQRLLDGAFVMTWELHWVAGWDPIHQECRATVADCYGHAEVMRGSIRGDLLTFESIGDPPVRLRLVWDFSDLAHPTWRNEMSAGGAPWFLVEEYELSTTRPLPGGGHPLT